MVSFITSPTHLSFFKKLSLSPIITAFPLVGTKKNVTLKFQNSHFVSVKLVKKSQSLSCNCKGGGEDECELALEGEILDFMKGSKRPQDFPTKAELVESGRKDLVDAIVKRGGWLSMGWDLDENEEEKSDKNVKLGGENGVMGEENDINGGVVRGFDENVETFGEDGSWVSTSFYLSPTLSERSFEMGDKEEDSGVTGILARLEKERNLCLGANLTKQPLSSYSSEDSVFEASADVDGAPNDKIIANAEGSLEFLEDNRNSSYNDIRTRLQHLELELTSTLTSLRSKSEKLISEEGYENSTDIHKLSDALEFQETEIMNAKDSLRAIRAKLAVLEGKMTLAIIGTRKKIDEKQQKIDGARRALHLLRDISVAWPNSASEVFLVGSFDGWTTQRRMNKSSTGIFSVELKLYPGKYEIKFIVDGVWKVDPLRPIVKNNGYDNNLFTVT